MGIKARGPGGVEWEFDYPLSPYVEAQLKSRELRMIERTGEDARPEPTDSREAWINYLIRVHDMDPDSAKNVSKTELIEWANKWDEEAGW